MLVSALASLSQSALAGGVSAYLPLNLEPEMERQIERVLILADEPILKRPFAVELVLAALPQACKVDKPLCTKVKRYLQRYSRDYAVTHASATGAVTHDNDGGVVPNSHGLPVNSSWEFSAQGYVQPNDYVLLSGGAIAYSGRTVPTGSMLSLGFNWAQLDIGYRDHWLSPATDSSMLISTESPTMPSVTLSNYEPLTRFGFQYELLLVTLVALRSHRLPRARKAAASPTCSARNSPSSRSAAGRSGSIGICSMAAASGMPTSLRFLLAKAFFKPSGEVADSGQSASVLCQPLHLSGKDAVCRVFPVRRARTPRTAAATCSAIRRSPPASTFPRFWRSLRHDVRNLRMAEHLVRAHIFLDGMTNDGLVVGNWGADQRNFGDGVGARSQMLRIGWEPPFGGYLEERVRTVVNQNYYGGDTSRLYYRAPAPFRTITTTISRCAIRGLGRT